MAQCAQIRTDGPDEHGFHVQGRQVAATLEELIMVSIAISIITVTYYYSRFYYYFYSLLLFFG